MSDNNSNELKAKQLPNIELTDIPKTLTDEDMKDVAGGRTVTKSGTKSSPPPVTGVRNGS